MAMNRRLFIAAPLVAVGAGLAWRAADFLAKTRDAALPLSLLRLRGSDGTAADAALTDTVWDSFVPRGDLERTRIVLHGFVPASADGIARDVRVHALYTGERGNFNAHELYRHSSALSGADGRSIGFDAVRGAFAGLRIEFGRHAADDLALSQRIGEAKLSHLAPGLYALAIDARGSARSFAYSGDRTRPLANRNGIPDYLAFSVAAKT